MPESQCLAEIRSRLDTWSAKERKVASYILENPRDSVDPSIEELAERIGVSESTLFRFVRKLGYSGYQQFRIALATEAISPRDTWYDSPEAGIDEKSAAAVVFKTSIAALEATLAGLDPELLDRAAEAMTKALRVPILGIGGSNAVAQDAWHKLIRTGLPCEAPVDFHMQLMLASQSGPESLVILFSHTGSNTDALALADEAKLSGARLLIVTSQPRSPLAKRADFLITSRSSGARLVSEAWSGRIAQLAIIDTLYVLVMEKLGGSGERHLESMRRAIARRRL
ncbi:MAG TPA: MurR/RpiR family transcriptional regulator [Rectinemataceae bacterium]|nr:MurR/RpiR family transcriptional regulator [Rectinemataceae bacterium]